MRGIIDNLDLSKMSETCQCAKKSIALTFMGRPSTRRPLRSLAALAAVSALPKMIEAMPRLVPFWLYVSITFLTGPADLEKYSYSVNRDDQYFV